MRCLKQEPERGGRVTTFVWGVYGVFDRPRRKRSNFPFLFFGEGDAHHQNTAISVRHKKKQRIERGRNYALFKTGTRKGGTGHHVCMGCVTGCLTVPGGNVQFSVQFLFEGW